MNRRVPSAVAATAAVVAWQGQRYGGAASLLLFAHCESELDAMRGPLAVRPEQVGSLVEAGDRGLAAEGAVWAVMVVVVQPAVKGGGAL